MVTDAPAEVEVRELHDLEELRAACGLFAEIWGRGADPPVAPELLRAVAHSGGYVAGAHAGGSLVGASMAFLGRDHERSEMLLHSHITGVLPTSQGLGVGLAIKRHQQSWAAERGIPAITWTYDPLVRRNGRFNLTKLGAVGVAYLPDFYGQMTDALNRADPTDRLVARLEVDASSRRDVDVQVLQQRGAEVVVRSTGQGPSEPAESTAPIRLVQVPADIVELRQNDPSTSLAWRMATREAMGRAFADGLVALGVSADGWCVFAGDEEVL